MNYQKIIDELDFKTYSCVFSDIRIETTTTSTVRLKDGDIVQANSNPTAGYFIRVYNKGQWFYQSSTDFTKIDQNIRRLIELSQDYPEVKSNYSGPIFNGTHQLIKYENDRFDKITMDEKISIVKKYELLKNKIANIAEYAIAYTDIYKQKYYKNSKGTAFAYDFNQAGLNFRVTLKNGENLFEDGINNYASNFGALLKLEDQILKHFEEAQKFLNAKTVEPGKYDLVLSPELVGIFTHESFGHKSEADFMIGDPEAIKEWELGKKVGSDILSIIDSGLHENTSGYCPIDDEGNLAKKNYLIKDGKLTGRLHSTETAHELNEEPTSNCRAMNFEWEPIVRMTSTYIEAGTDSFEQILKKAGDSALYLDGANHGTGGSTFTIAPKRAYRIKDGKLSEPLKVALISGSVFETLNNITAVGSDFKLWSSAFGGCGKMSQMPLPVADGGPTILVKGMTVS